jgi:hypothetical protein
MQYPGTGSWDSNTGDWIQGGVLPIAPTTAAYYPENGDSRRDIFRNGMPNGDGSVSVQKEPVPEANGRKKRRNIVQLEDAQEYQPGMRRVCAMSSAMIILALTC